MTLLQRIEESSPKKDTDEFSLKAKLRKVLYEHIAPHSIAKLIKVHPIRARKELAAIIDAIGAELLEVDQSLSLEECGFARDALLDDILGLGPIETLLADPSVTEIMINGHDSIFLERNGKLEPANLTFDNDEQVRLIVDRIIAPLGRRLDERTPLVNARLSEGHRLNAIIPPLAISGPVVTIRKFREKIYSLSQLVDIDTLTSEMETFLRWSVQARKNIAVTGGTGSGKTTLLNALSVEISHGERIITIEDSAELRFQTHPHVISLESRSANLEGEGEITIQELVINSLRMRPDRIIVGECRGGEALDMLQAMNTGHNGSLTTLHANSPTDAISRLVTMVRYVTDLPLDAIKQQIFSALELIVHEDRMADGSRKITSIVECCKVENKNVLRRIFCWKRTGVSENGEASGHFSFCKRPFILDEFINQGIVTKAEGEKWLSLLAS